MKWLFSPTFFCGNCGREERLAAGVKPAARSFAFCSVGAPSARMMLSRYLRASLTYRDEKGRAVPSTILTGLISRVAFELARELTEILRNHLRPNEYGDGLERVHLSLICPGSGVPGPTGLKIGAYKPSTGAFYCTLTFPEAFSDWSPTQQRQFFTQAVESASDALQKKMRKATQPFDFAAFRSDLASALATWTSGIAGSSTRVTGA